MEPKVSVIIPCYNCEETIEDTVESVFNQTYKNIELILVDDCSSSALSFKKLQSFQAKYPNKDIKVFQTNKNSGQSAVRNIGILNSNGKYIAFLDSDDIWLPNKIEKQVEFMETHLECFVSGTLMSRLSNKKKNKSFTQDKSPKKVSLKKLVFRNVFGMSTILIRNNPIFLFDENIRYSSDFHFLCDILSSNYSGFLQMFVGTIYNDVRSGRISSTSKKKQFSSDKLLLAKLKKAKKINIFEYIFFYVIYNIKYIRNVCFR